MDLNCSIIIMPVWCVYKVLFNEVAFLFQAFGFTINYQVIVTALGALGVAFATRLVLDEIST